MKVEFKPAFDKGFKKLDARSRGKGRAAIESLLDYLDHETPVRVGLGLKNVREDFWEIRVDLKLRIIFELSDRLVFRLIGGHEEIRRFIKRRSQKEG